MDRSTVHISIATAIDPPWTALTPIRLGAVPLGAGTPDLFILVALSDEPTLRLDLYRANTSELYVRDEAIAWRRWIAVGFGYRVFLVNLDDHHVLEIPIPLYFERFWPGEDYLLILAGQGLVLVEETGRVAWTNDDLAIDGVEIDAIDAGVISGRGEWDPPGGWRSFRVQLNTGRLIAQAV